MGQHYDSQVERRPYLVLAPNTPGEILKIVDEDCALRMACVDREHSSRLLGEWDVAGIYVLLWPVSESGEFKCYVGKGNPMTDRVTQHRTNKSGWTRALVVASNQSPGFDSAQIGWLEGQLHSRVQNSTLGTAENVQQPGDDTVPNYSLRRLSNAIDSVVRVLRLIGYECAEDSEMQIVARKRRKSSTSSSVTIADLLAAGLLKDGEDLVSVNGQWPAKAKVKSPDSIRFKNVDYDSPSGAGEAARDGGATNGWAFWAVIRDGETITLSVLRAEYEKSRQK